MSWRINSIVLSSAFTATESTLLASDITWATEFILLTSSCGTANSEPRLRVRSGLFLEASAKGLPSAEGGPSCCSAPEVEASWGAAPAPPTVAPPSSRSARPSTHVSKAAPELLGAVRRASVCVLLC
eukprot:CAMPEP_0115072346 /NCGR_PEP_ID=MMETSP0227-20121206/14176_1 /TAXON_ID=89957 /ORGANISM="Polarella glacialis, Strain CCMP 1383" /LENGTH=126 /DNA_ID=CAMNT_0002459077 /DNA_START=399 /DNA_END=780 /DNA_ORIENTATION=+